MTRIQGPESSREERLTDMIHQYEKDILRLCYTLLHDADLARDAVQDTFLKAYTHLDCQQEPGKEKNWLVSIAPVNTCRDYLRSSWVRHVNRSIQPEDLPVAVSPPSEDRMVLTAAIMNLPQKYAEVVILRYVQGLNIQEAAEALHITPSAVSRRCKKACQKLRKELERGETSNDGNGD